MTTHEILLAAQAAKLPLALADTDTKNAALEAMAVALVENSDAILAANKQDLAAARGRISDVMLDRLALTPARLAAMAKGMREVAALPDPVGAVLRKIVRPNGLLIEKTSVPMGVIAIIYESRPNVTSDAAALALKSGNACILRSGKEAFRSADAIVRALHKAHQLPVGHGHRFLGQAALGFRQRIAAKVSRAQHQPGGQRQQHSGDGQPYHSFS